MSSFLCFVCHSTVNADTNEDTRDKYREVIGMNLCPDSHLCYICCHFLNKMWLFKSICLKRSLEYPVLFSLRSGHMPFNSFKYLMKKVDSPNCDECGVREDIYHFLVECAQSETMRDEVEKGTINLQRSDTQVGILCPEDICLQQLNSKYHFYKTNENSPPEPEENKYVQLHEEMNFGLLPNNLEVQTDDIFDNFNVNLLKTDSDVHFNNVEFLDNISKDNTNTRRDIDEFIFGNDSIESPLENINKIELTNLDEMTEVNITLTDLNVRNIEKLQEFNVKDEMTDKTYFTNDFVGNPQDCIRNSSFVEKTHELRNNYVEKPEQYMPNSFEKHDNNITENIFIERSQTNNVLKSPKLVKNIDFIENTQEFINNDYDKSSNELEKQEVIESDDESDIIINNFNEQGSNDDRSLNNSPINDSDETNSNEKVQIKKNVYNKITLSLEEQKMDLEASRRTKKYTEAVFKCFSCGIGFLFKDTYQAHMMRHEESNGEHRCSVCTLRFANPAVLRSHQANHAVRYQCTHCEDVLRGRHRLTHACGVTNSVSVACHICGNVFQGASQYKQHLKRIHQESSGRSYLCSVCGKSFTNQAAVRTHMLTHINKKFTCDVCSSTFSSPYTLNQHKKKHELRFNGLHYCAACNFGYSSRKSLLAHQRNALAHKERVYKCAVCERTCPTLGALQQHTAAVHTRCKDLFCAVCPARYSTRKGLLRHMRSHNNLEPRQLPLCHACGQTFKSTSILKRHLKNVCEKDKLEEELSNYYDQ